MPKDRPTRSAVTATGAKIADDPVQSVAIHIAQIVELNRHPAHSLCLGDRDSNNPCLAFNSAPTPRKPELQGDLRAHGQGIVRFHEEAPLVDVPGEVRKDFVDGRVVDPDDEIDPRRSTSLDVRKGVTDSLFFQPEIRHFLPPKFAARSQPTPYRPTAFRP